MKLCKYFLSFFASALIVPLSLAEAPINVDNLPGADISAKINAFIAKRKNKSKTPVEFVVNNSGSIKTPIIIEGPSILRFGVGTYQVEAPIRLSGTGAALLGAHYGATRLVAPKTANFPAAMVEIASGAERWRVQNLSIDREVKAVASGNGIQTFDTNNNGTIEDVIVSNHYIGFYLGPTGHSVITRCKAFNSTSHGFYFVNNKFMGPAQYHLSEILSEQNGGAGFYLHPAHGTMSVGSWNKISTFMNRGAAIHAARVGSSTVESLRVTDLFIGNDSSLAAAGLIIEGGTLHQFTNLFVELEGQFFECAGTQCTGRYVTPAHGILLNPGVGTVMLTNAIISGSGGNGITTGARSLMISNSTISNNGMIRSPGIQGGIVTWGDKPGLSVTNTNFLNDTGTQLIAVQAVGNAKVTISNSTAPTSGSFNVPVDAILNSNRLF